MKNILHQGTLLHPKAQGKQRRWRCFRVPFRAQVKEGPRPLFLLADIVDIAELEAVFLKGLALRLDAPVGIVVEVGEEAVGVGV